MMKKIILIAILVTITWTGAFSQNQGSISIGGSFNFSVDGKKTTQNNTTVSGPTYTQFYLSPSIEYFLSDNFSVGGGIGYLIGKEKDFPSSNQLSIKETEFSIAPMARMYFGMGDKASLFAQASVGFGFGKEVYESKNNNTTVSTTTKNSSIDFGVRPGFRFLVSDRLALESTFGFVGFSSDKSNNKTVTNNSFQINFSPSSFMLGIRFFL